MKICCADGCDRAFAEFELAAPSPAIEHGLWVSTANQELTVGIHTHHSHFTGYDDCFDPDPIYQALDYIQELLDEHRLIASWYVGDRFVGSTSYLITDGYPSLLSFESITRTTIRSWRGTHDNDIGADVSH